MTKDRLKLATTVLFSAGAVLMPLGLFAVGYGWYGAASTRYEYDQFPYLLSGGLIGVCLTTIGGFLYFGAWIARGQAEQRAAAQQLNQNLEALPGLMARELAALLADGVQDGTAVAAETVAAGSGTTVHRRDCRLVAHRDDVRPVAADEPGMRPCRVCMPAG